MSTNVQVGDIVTVVRTGLQYTTYSDMALWMGLTRWEEPIHIDPFINHQFKVVSIKMHVYNSQGLLAGIESLTNGAQFIIGIRGIELVKSSSPYSQVIRIIKKIKSKREALGYQW